MPSVLCKAQFKNILLSWDDGVDISSIFHMILSWIHRFRLEIESPDVLDLLQRIDDNNQTASIVEDVVYKRYVHLREEMK